MARTSPYETQSEIKATPARQGRLGRDVFWVLVISTVLAFTALVAAWGWNAERLSSTEPNNARQPQDARAFDAPSP